MKDRTTSKAKILVGDTGFVGTTLARQTAFHAGFRSGNIQDIRGVHASTVVCAAAPAQKWIANREPEADLKNIRDLMSHLDTIECERFILISTVDVFKQPQGVYEDTPVDLDNLHPYGRHRRFLETFVETRFQNSLIVRLPGLVGPGLRKNIIFDFLNDNNIQAIDSRSVFQFYPMVNLWSDIQIALNTGLSLVHLTAAPISVADVAEQGFGQTFDHPLAGTSAAYDMRTRYADLFDGTGDYQYNRRESLLAIRAYAQSESQTQPKGGAA